MPWKCPCCGKVIPIISGNPKPPNRRIRIPPCNTNWDAGSPPAAVVSNVYMGKVGKLDLGNWVFRKKSEK